MLQTSRLLCGLLSIGTILSGSAFAADARLVNMVMPDVKVLAGVNVTSASTSPLGRFLIAKLTSTGDLQKFAAATGFNPLQDVYEVLAASSADPAGPSGLIMATGKFPVDKFVSLIGSTSGPGTPQISSYGGTTLITFTGPNANMAHGVAFFANSSIAVAGDIASVKAAIDRSTAANSLDPSLALKVNSLSSQDEWLISTAPVASLLPANASGAAQGPVAQVLPLIKSIQSFDGGVKFGDNVVVSGEAVTNDPKNALALSAVAKLGLTLLGSVASGQKDPRLTDLVALLQNMQLTTNGPALELTLSIPETQIENLLNSAKVVRTAAVSMPPHPEIHKGN
jgi:hypothetical protein